MQLADPTYAGGANHPALVDAQRNFVMLGACEERLRQFVRPADANDVRDPLWRPFDPGRDAVTGPRFAPDDTTAVYYWRHTA